jgi:hypothetical protein
MGHIYSYTVLMAVPDARRGERVNIGICVFLADRLDVRISDAAKVRAIAGGDWQRYASEFAARVGSLFGAGESAADMVARFSLIEPVIQFSELSWFTVEEAGQYESRVTDILTTLVSRPKETRPRKATRINTEIAKEFQRTKALAAGEETIEDHKVVRDYDISVDEDLRADFVVKNGMYHVTATLDLRRENVHISQAAWKAVVLLKAREVFSAQTRTLGVYAMAPGATQFRSHVEILRDYSDRIFNWTDPGERRGYEQAIYAAMQAPGNFTLN